MVWLTFHLNEPVWPSSCAQAENRFEIFKSKLSCFVTIYALLNPLFNLVVFVCNTKFVYVALVRFLHNRHTVPQHSLFRRYELDIWTKLLHGEPTKFVGCGAGISWVAKRHSDLHYFRLVPISGLKAGCFAVWHHMEHFGNCRLPRSLLRLDKKNHVAPRNFLYWLLWMR